MPAKRSTRVSKTHTRKKTRRGGSVLSWIKEKAIPWLKSSKLISRGASALASVLPPQYAGIASAVSSGASKFGFGRRRSSRGGALSYGRTGGSLMSEVPDIITFVFVNVTSPVKLPLLSWIE